MATSNLVEKAGSKKYYEELKERSFLECYEELKQKSLLDGFSHGPKERCKLHDIIHDLARLNSENEHYSVQINQAIDIQKENILQEAYHLYASGFFGYVNQILQQNLNGLRTLSMDLRACKGDLDHEYCKNNIAAMDLNLKLSECYEECSREVQICNLTNFKALRVLKLKGDDLTRMPDFISNLKLLVYLDITSSSLEMLPQSIGLLYNLRTLILHCDFLEYLPDFIGLLYNLQTLILDSESLEYLPDSISELKHLAYLDIISSSLKMLPRSIGLLFNLQTLILYCSILEYLPESIGDLLNLQFLDIHSDNLRYLPKSLGSLSNLLGFVIEIYDLLDYVPHGLVNFPTIKKMTACLRVKTIDWLKDTTGLEGNLSIYGMSNLKDAQRANMRNKCKLETLNLCGDAALEFGYHEESDVELMLKLEACEDKWVGVDDEEFSWLESLQPHPNLKKLRVGFSKIATLPGWMSDPSSLQSIQEVLLEYYCKIQSLPFSTLHTLKHLTIHGCHSIRVLQLEQLPSQLEELRIDDCFNLELITGLGNLDMLATLEIGTCPNLK